MEPEVLARVFEPFTQADQSLDRGQGGLGLGLALVKGLVELHGGQVSAESAGAGRGASFTLRLPLAGAVGASPASASETHRSVQPLRVEIVEDNRDAAESLRDVLELFGCTVVIAYSGLDALERAREFQPQIVLCDLGLPGMDGFQVARELRRDPATAGVRLIAISGYGQEEDQRRSREAGFDLHLTKPVDFAQLQQQLEAASH
jgi:CheY-like chemotaxis protein